MHMRRLHYEPSGHASHVARPFPWVAVVLLALLLAGLAAAMGWPPAAPPADCLGG